MSYLSVQPCVLFKEGRICKTRGLDVVKPAFFNEM